MKTNAIESWAMKSTVRKWILRKVEFPRFKQAIEKYFGDKDSLRVLEIGCGAGFGTRLLYEHLSNKSFDAIDLDPDMVETAKARNKQNPITFRSMSAVDLSFKKNQFDVIFELGIFHHIPLWKKAIKEVYRVLEPGGYFILEDLHKKSFYGSPLRSILRHLTDHPYKKMFSYEDFIIEMKKVGFQILEKETFKWKLDYFFIIAQKQSS